MKHRPCGETDITRGFEPRSWGSTPYGGTKEVSVHEKGSRRFLLKTRSASSPSRVRHALFHAHSLPLFSLWGVERRGGSEGTQSPPWRRVARFARQCGTVGAASAGRSYWPSSEIPYGGTDKRNAYSKGTASRRTRRAPLLSARASHHAFGCSCSRLRETLSSTHSFCLFSFCREGTKLFFDDYRGVETLSGSNRKESSLNALRELRFRVQHYYAMASSSVVTRLTSTTGSFAPRIWRPMTR